MKKEELEKELAENKARQKVIEAQLAKPAARDWFIQSIQSVNRPMLLKKLKPNEVFYYRNDEFIWSLENDVIWISYDNVWQILEKEYGLTYYEIQELTTDVMLNTFKCKVATTYIILTKE